MRRSPSEARRNQYRLALFGILSASSVIAIAILSVRDRIFNSDKYLFLVWNLILAWIPFLAAWATFSLRALPKLPQRTITLAGGLVWLVFFPNAPYILTDLQHLAEWRDAPIWYDVIMLLWFGLNGLLLGVISLYFIHEIVIHAFGSGAGWLFVTAAALMSGFGMYMGRFLEWNSWDVLRHPIAMTRDILGSLLHPAQRLDTLIFTVLFALLFLFFYIITYIFGHLAAGQMEE